MQGIILFFILLTKNKILTSEKNKFIQNLSLHLSFRNLKSFYKEKYYKKLKRVIVIYNQKFYFMAMWPFYQWFIK